MHLDGKVNILFWHTTSIKTNKRIFLSFFHFSFLFVCLFVSFQHTHNAYNIPFLSFEPYIFHVCDSLGCTKYSDTHRHVSEKKYSQTAYTNKSLLFFYNVSHFLISSYIHILPFLSVYLLLFAFTFAGSNIEPCLHNYNDRK